MKTHSLSLLTTSALLLSAAGTAFAQGTAFTYHGRLNDNGNRANGSYDLQFYLRDAATAGNPIGTTNTVAAVDVSSGLFTATLDFGEGIFTGADRWLEIGVRTNGGGAFTALSPRQQLTPTPYAITASNLTGTLPAAQLSGTLPSTQLGGLYSAGVTFNNAANSFAGSGVGLTGVNAATLGGLGASGFWQLTGNAGTSPDVNFLGTTDNQPLELKVNGQRAFRLEPTTNSPNVIGGFAGNYVYSNAVGATISGGGGDADGPNAVGTALFNPGSSFSSIGGGTANTIVRGKYSAIGGGRSNVIAEALAIGFASDSCNIGGGERNQIGGALCSFIGGGFGNVIAGDFISCGTISGGRNNVMRKSAPSSTIGGGADNFIQDASNVTIAGGAANSVVAGTSATIGGGSFNSIGFPSDGAIIGGGNGNRVANGSNSSYATIPGGQSNLVNATYGTIPGGTQAAARNYGQLAYASGAFQNGGDAQTSVYVCRNTTTDSTETELFLDGAARRMIVPTNSTWTFDILITGRTSAGESAGYHFLGVVENYNGTTALVGTASLDFSREDITGWSAAAMADDTTDALVVKVTGAAATTIRWVASVRAVEVSY